LILFNFAISGYLAPSPRYLLAMCHNVSPLTTVCVFCFGFSTGLGGLAFTAAVLFLVFCLVTITTFLAA